MTFNGNGNYALRSECGQYAITKNSHTSGDWPIRQLPPEGVSRVGLDGG